MSTVAPPFEQREADQPEISLSDALETYREGDWELAIQQLSDLLSDETAAEVLEPLGLSHYHVADYRTAVQHFERLLELEIKQKIKAATRVNLGNCHFKLGEISEAERFYQSSIDTDSDGLARYNMACVRCAQGEYHEALDWLEQALESNSDLHGQASQDLEPLRPYVRFEELIKKPNAVEKWVWEIGSCLVMPFIFVWYVASRLVPSRLRRKLRQAMLNLVSPEGAEIHGMKVNVSVAACWADQDTVVQQVDDALQLIRRCTPRTYTRIQSDLDWIFVTELVMTGLFEPELRACVLDRDLFDYGACDEDGRRRMIHTLANTIVHEACHARVFAMGRKRKDLTWKEERLCRKQEARFTEKAKQEPINAVDDSFDTAYEFRFGMYDKWYYDQYRRASWRDRVRDHLRRVETDYYFVFERFLTHVWSKPERYVAYVTDLDQALDARSKASRAWIGRGNLRGYIRRYAEAAADLQRAIELDPDSGPAWSLLGKLAFYNDDAELARSALQRAVEIEPKDATAFIWLIGLSIRSADHRPDAIEFSDRFAGEHKHRYAILNQAWARFANGQLEAAAEFVEKALDYHPDCHWSSSLAYDIYARMNRTEDAQRCWNQYCRAIGALTKEFKRPIPTNGIVLTLCQPDREYRLQVLTTPEAAAAQGLKQLAERLLQETSEPPQTIADDYLYSMVRRRIYEKDVFELPSAVAGRRSIFIAEVRVPVHCFDGKPAPQPLSSIPLCVDRKAPSSFTHQVFT